MAKNREKHAVTIYSRYERFWHWTQAGLIFTLAFTGFNLHGTFHVLSFETAVTVHTFAAIALMVLWTFTTFWNFVTGNWRQFLPFLRSDAEKASGKNPVVIFVQRVWAVARYYGWGILRGEEHPHKKTLRRKQNALQGLSYLTFMIMIGPGLWATGMAYLLYDFWSGLDPSGRALMVVAFLHTAAAFILLSFVIIHVYMTTTGKTVFHYIKTMITGVENVELTEVEKAYLEQEYPERLKD